MSKIFGEEHFIEQDMISLVYSEIGNKIDKIDKMVFDKMQQTIHFQFPEIKINEDKLRKWVLLCNNLENIEYSELVDIATKKKLSDLKQQLAEKDKEIERLKYRILYSQLQAPKEEIEKFNMLMSYKSLNYETQLRHQVCEEIREKAVAEAFYIDSFDDKREIVQYTISKRELDQIEKGEKNDKT